MPPLGASIDVVVDAKGSPAAHEGDANGSDPFLLGSILTSLSGSSASKCILDRRPVWIQPPFTVTATASLQVLVRGQDLNSDRAVEGWIDKSRLRPLEPD